MQPSAEALAWQRRADQWAQQADADQSQSVEPANRWSDVAQGRPTFPADGVGWRTETSEWRAAGARWRQTTEWRSTTGSHGFRSTTEAWQTDGNDSYRPPVDTPAAQPAISGNAWSPSTSADKAESRPAWQQFTSPSSGSSWPETQTPPAPRTPAESSPSWQQLVDPPAEQRGRQPWQRDAIEGTATWTDQAASRSAAKPPPPASDSMSSWLRMDEPAEQPSWQASRDDGRHLVREDDRAAWRRDADQGGGSPRVGRRRAPEDGSAPSGGTGWATRSDSDNWAGHTDTGSIPLFADPGTASTPPWSTGTRTGSTPPWSTDTRTGTGSGRHDGSTGRRALPSTPYDDDTPTGRRARRDDSGHGSRSVAVPLPTSYDDRPTGRAAEAPPATPRRSRYADEAPSAEARGYGTDAPATGYGRDTYPADPSAAAPTTGFGPGPAGSRRGADRGAYPADPPSSAPTTGYGRGSYSADPPAAAPITGYGRGTYSADPPAAAPTSSFGRGAASTYPADPPSSAPTTGYGRGGYPGDAAYPGDSAYPGDAPPASAPASGFGRGYPVEPPPTAPTTGYGRGGYPGDAPPAGGRGGYPGDAPPAGGRGGYPGDAPPASAPTSGLARGTGYPVEPPPPAPTNGFGRGAYPADAPPAGYGRGGGFGYPGEPPASAPTTGFGRGAGPMDQRDPGAGEQPGGGFGRGAAGYPADAGVSSTGIGRRRSRAAAEDAEASRFPEDDRGVAGARSGPGAPAGRRARPDGPPRPPSRGKARYNEVKDDWREHTGSWSAEPDTSSWTRDPDTGQWSRSEDDPRVTAWRAEAARRETQNHTGPPPRRELPAGPSAADDGGRAARRRPEQDDDDWGNPPAGGGSSAPRSGPAFGSPRRELTSGNTYGGGPDDGPGYDGGANGDRPGYGGATGDRRGYADGPSYDGGPGYADGPGHGGGPDDGPGYGGGTYGSSAGAGGPTYGSAAPASGPAYGSARRELPSGRARADDTTAYGAAPTSGPAYGSSVPTSGTAYGSPRRELSGGRARADEAGAPPSSAVTYGAPGNAPRSGLPYGARPAGDDWRSELDPGGSARRGAEPVADWRQDLDPNGARPAAEPAGAAGWRRDLEPNTGGRRRAEEEPPGAAGWRRELDPEGAGRPSGGTGTPTEAPSWTLGEPGNKDLSSWQLSDEPDNGRGSAVYREGGDNDWRRDLADRSSLAEGESRRFGTSDYLPFRPSGSAAVESSNLSSTSTSLISPVPRAQPEPRSGSWQSGMTGSYERRPVTGSFPTIRKSDLLDPDDEEGDQEAGGPLAAVGYTVIWYGVPIVLFIVYMLVVNSDAKTHALDTLAGAAPQFLISLVLSVLVAVGLRKFSSSWKAISVGLAAAVVGGGLATVLASAITGNSLS
ncbi:hypothetical protein [Paractinoplanes ferrugineus]|nr:hypothetical protein [Actinoplanes ferrugineus]